MKQSDVSQASHPKLRYLCRVGLGCTGEGAPQAAAGLAPKALVETHQQRDWGGGSGAQVATGLLGTAFPSHPSRSCWQLGDVPCGCQRWSPPHHGVESHQTALLLGPPADLDFAYGEHPRREAVTAELWAPAHPELLYVSLPSRETRPFLSLRSLRLRAPLLPTTEKPCRPITLSNRLSPPLAREQLLE